MKLGRKFFLEAALGALLVAAPAAFGSVYAWAHMTAAGILFFALSLSADLVVEKVRFPLSLFSFLMLIAFLVFQSFFVSKEPYLSLCEIIQWLAWAACFVLVQVLAPGQVLRLLGILAAAGVFQSAYGLWQAASGSEKVLWQAKEAYLGFVTGTYFNRNHLAGFLEMCLGILTGFLCLNLSRRSFLKSVLLITALAGMLLTLFMTGSRMGTVSFLAGLLFFLVTVSARFSFSKAAVLGAGLFLGAAIIFFAASPVFQARFQEVFANRGNWAGGRFLVWESALNIGLEHSLTGIGLGTFSKVFPAYQPSELSFGWAHAHNDYLELFIELGAPAFALLLFLFGMLFRRVLRTLPAADPEKFYVVSGVLSGLLSIGIHGLTDFNFAIPANVLIFVFLAAAAWRLS